jgi:hypothetical protein
LAKRYSLITRSRDQKLAQIEEITKQKTMKITNDIYLAPKDREPEEEPDPEQELSADEMDRIDAINESRSKRFNGR